MKFSFVAWITIFFPQVLKAIECGPSQYHVRAHSVSAYTKSDGTVVKGSFHKESCKDKSDSYLYWNDKIKNDRPNNWPNSTEKSVNWSEDERQRLLDSLDKIPEELWLKSFKGFYRMQKSKDFPNPASEAEGWVVLYDSAFDPKRNLSRILFHELGHVYYKSQTPLFREEYREISGWNVQIGELRNFKQTRRKSGYVQEDGKLGAEEDFANNLEFFAFDEKILTKETPLVRDWMKKRFGDTMKLRKQ